MAEDIRLTDAQVSELRDQCEKHRDEVTTSRGDWPSRHAERIRRFNADPTLRPPGPWPGAPSIFVPITRDVTEKLQGEIHDLNFGQPENLVMEPFGEEDVKNAEMATDFLHWTLRAPLIRQNWWLEESLMAIFDALLDSAAICKVVAWSPPWDMPAESARYFDRIVRIDSLDVQKVLVPPDATGMQFPEARFIGQEFYLTKDDLLRMKRQGYEVPSPDETSPRDQQPTERQRAEIEREGIQPRPFYPDTYLFVEMYTRFVTNPRKGSRNLEEDVIVSYFPDAPSGDGTSSRGLLSRVRRLIDVFPQDDRPRRPFFDLSVWPQPRQWRGLNTPDRLESMQDLINRLHEQMVNYGDVSMLPYVFANTFLTGDLPNLRQVQPGSTVPIEDLNGVQFAPTRSLNRHFAEQIQLLMSNIERDSKVTDATLGRSADRPNQPRTASASLAYLAESKRSFGASARRIAVQFSRMLSFYFRLWQSVLPPVFSAPLTPASRVQNAASRDILMRLYQGDLKGKYVATRIQKEQLSGLFDAALHIDPDALFDRQALIAMSQLILPLIPNYTLGQRELVKRVWEAHRQRGFEQIWPEDVATTQTQIQLLGQEIQLVMLQQQLQQIGAQQAQAQVQARAQAEQAAQQQAQAAVLAPSANGTQAPLSRQIIDELGFGAAPPPEQPL